MAVLLLHASGMLVLLVLLIPIIMVRTDIVLLLQALDLSAFR